MKQLYEQEIKNNLEEVKEIPWYWELLAGFLAIAGMMGFIALAAEVLT